jgi:NADPH:quinone reductase
VQSTDIEYRKKIKNKMIKAITVHEFGGPEVLKSESIELPEPGEEEVRLKHLAIGVNYIDTYYRTGLYPVDLPYVPGEEGIGIIEQMGSSVTGFNTGDRVAYATISQDAYASARNIHYKELVPVPDELSDQQVASSLTRGLTAEYLLFRCHQLKPGQSILVHAAAGGVGSVTCQWAKALGATVFGTVSSVEKVEQAKRFGCDEVIVYTEQSFSEVIKDKTNGELLDVVYDGVGKATLSESMQCVKPRGLLVSYGNASGAPDPLNILDLSKQGSIYLTRPKLYDYTRDRTELMNAAKRYFDALIENTIKLPEIITLPLEEAHKAHEMLQDRNRKALPVLVP